LKDTAQAITSLDTPIGDDGAALQDFLEDEQAVGPDELAVEAVGREALEQVLRALPERARQVERDALAALRSPETRARLHDLDGAA
jgi:DNA-directed RNA polymerase sigma subunit (sigma70/sigma32)